MGIPEMEEYWNSLLEKISSNTATKSDIIQHKKLVKTLNHLKDNPKYPGLHTHEINQLSERYGMRVWQSYIENNKPAAGRIYWVYYPTHGITIIGIEPHPDDKKDSYNKIRLSSTNNWLCIDDLCNYKLV